MRDLNDVRLFERVAMLGSFSAAARSLGVPKSTVSRGVARLEADLGVCLLRRTTRRVGLTPAGQALHDGCDDPLGRLNRSLDHVAGLGGQVRGTLRVRAGIGFGVNVLGRHLPAFLMAHPGVDVSLDLTSKLGTPAGDDFDCAVQLGPLPDSGLRSVPLGGMGRHLCAAPAYLARRGRPRALADLPQHDAIEMPRGDGRPRQWVFARDGRTERIDVRPRVMVNEALTVLRLVQCGAGLGVVSGYLCEPAVADGSLVRLFPDWTLPPVEVNLVFPDDRERSPLVTAFVTFMTGVARADGFWKGK